MIEIKAAYKLAYE